MIVLPYRIFNRAVNASFELYFNLDVDDVAVKILRDLEDFLAFQRNGA